MSYIEIKLEEKSITNSLLEQEHEILHALLNRPLRFGVPVLKACGDQSGYFYIITTNVHCVPLREFAHNKFLPNSMVIKIAIEIVCIYFDTCNMFKSKVSVTLQLSILLYLHEVGIILVHLGLDNFWVAQHGRDFRIGVRGKCNIIYWISVVTQIFLY